MDIEDPRWDEYEIRFRALAETVVVAKGPQPELASAEMMLFLYGETVWPPIRNLRCWPSWKPKRLT